MVTVSGGGTLTGISATCPRGAIDTRESFPSDVQTLVAAVPRALAASSGSPSSASSSASVSPSSATNAEGARRAQVFPGFGPCLQYVLQIAVTGGTNM